MTGSATMPTVVEDGGERLAATTGCCALLSWSHVCARARIVRPAYPPARGGASSSLRWYRCGMGAVSRGVPGFSV